MDGVADEFEEEVVIEEACSDDADFAVVERGHGVAEVGEVAEAGEFGLLDLCGGGGGVCGGAGDAVGGGLFDEGEGTGHVGCEGEDEGGEDLMEAVEFFEVRRADVFGVLCAGVFGVDEGSFDVEAGGAAEFGVVGVGVVGGAGGGDFLQFGLGLGEAGGEPGGDAFAEFGAGDVADGVEGVVADVVSVGAVGVDVDEAGHEHAALGIDGGVGGWGGL